MSIRLWYPQLDVYDCIRRFGLLINTLSHNSISIERLYICDFYLANSPLLHNTKMTQDVRDQFSQLNIIKPEKDFLSFPAAPILFNKMEPIQKKALQTLIGKGLIDENKYKNNFIVKSAFGHEVFLGLSNASENSHEKEITDFLINHYSLMAIDEIHEFRKHSGLRRAS